MIYLNLFPIWNLDLVAEEDHVQFNVVHKDKSDFYSIVTSEYPGKFHINPFLLIFSEKSSK